MCNRVTLIAILVAIFGGLEAAAQQATEIFIPVGQSPGNSSKYTVIGRVQSIDRENRTITVVNSTGTHVVKIVEETYIWIDRSKMKRSNEVGAMADCRQGLLCEVKYQSEKKRAAANWIKIQME